MPNFVTNGMNRLCWNLWPLEPDP